MSRTRIERDIARTFESVEQGEGVGARVRRSIGRPELKQLDPFLMLDEFKVKYPAGFPDHPHRGIETVTYMLEGRIQHEDFCGHKGVIGPGDLQWMTAGRGIVHCEVPADNTTTATGLQLWVNMPKKDKMTEPKYQELLAKDIPAVKKDGVWVAVIAGESMGLSSPVRTFTPTMYLHFKMDPHTSMTQEVPDNYNGFVYTISGEAQFGKSAKSVKAHHTIHLTSGTEVTVKTTDQPVSFVLIAGVPLNEPTVQHGPFVMNTKEEIMKTFSDFYSATNGFEKAKGWSSEVVKSGRY